MMSGTTKSPDLVKISRLHFDAQLTNGNFWHQTSLQPLTCSVTLKTDFFKASETDDLRYSLNYATISNNILSVFRNSDEVYGSIESIAHRVAESVFSDESNGQSAEINVSSEKSEIRCDSIDLSISRYRKDDSTNELIAPSLDKFTFKGLNLFTIIGVYTFERYNRQSVVLNLSVHYDSNKVKLKFSQLTETVSSYVESTQFKTVEALAGNVASLVLQEFDFIEATDVEVVKLNAITFADGVGVATSKLRNQLQRSKIVVNLKKSEFSTLPNLNKETSFEVHPNIENHRVFIAFGTNEGDYLENIEKTISELDKRGCKVEKTSSLYESAPMYHLDQARFQNGVFQVSTKLSPRDLLKTLKEIEYGELKRIKHFDNGPRTIDLDILLYDDLIYDEPDLKIPHVSLIERNFVLYPLCDLLPPTAIHPVTAEPFHQHLKRLSAHDTSLQADDRLVNIIPIPSIPNRKADIRIDTIGNKLTKSLVMAVLNVTPDSFSDGGLHSTNESIISVYKEMVHSGVDIIDIGGVSTRPGATAPSEEVELSRVIPAIQLIRNYEKENSLQPQVISVDTFRSQVALKSLESGANIVNDISGGRFDEQIFDVVAKFGAPYMVGHTRGENMTDMHTHTRYKHTQKIGEVEFWPSSPLIDTIGREIAESIQLATRKGVKRWQLIVDPGLGFAKTVEQNISLIRNLPNLAKYGVEADGEYQSLHRVPFLLGPSRKRFIGVITGEELPRSVGTCAAVMSCIGFGGHLIRVHDFKAVKVTCGMADAIYKGLIQS
ncbi:BA75_02195T0 [Komagataella pastoris]|uniref:BA75_02195T0 n=1 Tax=Komagataella pastoris TaxID=4922 RepID=A0A1B2JBM8_PICPA|nr:BA75_02195T0 [Komagataella pastoris]